MKNVSKEARKEDTRLNPQNYSKKCKCCGINKLLTEFPKSTRRFDRRETICKTCANEQRIRAKAYYPVLVAEHGANCSICGISEKENGKRLAVDHCHKSGKVRGLLCDNHNHGIGKFQECVETMKKAIEYIERHKSGRKLNE